MMKTFITCFICLLAFTQVLFSEKQETITLYIGTKNTLENNDLHICQINLKDNKVLKLKEVEESDGCKIIKLSQKHQLLFTVGDIYKNGQHEHSLIKTYKILSNHQLELVHQHIIDAKNLCYLDINEEHQLLTVADISLGLVGLYKFNSDGMIQPKGELIKVNPHEKSKMHCVRFTADGKGIIAADISTKKLFFINIDPIKAAIKKEKNYVHLQLKTSPRYLERNPLNDQWYVLNQIDSLVSHFQYDHSRQSFELLDQVSTLSSNYEGKNHSSDLQFIPNSNRVIAGNRNAHSFALFDTDPSTGTLHFHSRIDTGSDAPWTFLATDNAQVFISCNPSSNKVSLYNINLTQKPTLVKKHFFDLASPISVAYLW